MAVFRLERLAKTFTGHAKGCPGASSLDEVEADCPDATVYTEADTNVSIVTIDSKQFWQIEGLSSTGGLSTTIVLAATGAPWQILTQLVASLMIMVTVYAIKSRTKSMPFTKLL